ncbi:ATP-binding cassette sub- D member 4 [Quaeritorhiza haematococci]|nr:ATP-binding cassette sub- D member 4 [Quaeritorhiza haematococci]
MFGRKKRSSGGPPPARLDRVFLRRLWHILRILFAWGEDTVLTIYIALIVVSVVNEVFTYFTGLMTSEFYLVLNNKDLPGFQMLVVKVVFMLLGFSICKSALNFVGGWFALRARRRLTRTLHDLYVTEGGLYPIVSGVSTVPVDGADKGPATKSNSNAANGHTPGIRVDNPDQRITDDVGRFTEEIRHILQVLVIDPFLIAYYTWKTAEISGSFIGPLCVYAYFVISAIACKFAVAPLVPLVFKREKEEGNLRYLHVRVRQYAEEVALLGGEKEENRRLNTALDAVLYLQKLIISWEFLLKAVTEFFNYFGSVINYVIIGIPVFGGLYDDKTAAELSSLISQNSFMTLYLIYRFTVITDLSDRYSDLSGYTARIGQLLEVGEALKQARENKKKAPFGTYRDDKSTDSGSRSSGGCRGNDDDDATLGHIKIDGGSETTRDGSNSSDRERDSNSLNEGRPLLKVVVVNRAGSYNHSSGSSTAGDGSTSDDIQLETKVTPTSNTSSPAAVSKQIEEDSGKIVIQDLTFGAPQHPIPPLVENLTFTVESGSSMLITGPTGVGKSSLIRVLSGLWPSQSGWIQVDKKDTVVLSQRPYIVPGGSLKDQILYPKSSSEADLSDEELRDLLASVGLLYLLDPGRHHLFHDDTSSTSSSSSASSSQQDPRQDLHTSLSPGEQQRLVWARLLYHRPRFAIMDEPTSAVDEQGEERLFGLAQEKGITCVVVAHRRLDERKDSETGEYLFTQKLVLSEAGWCLGSE